MNKRTLPPGQSIRKHCLECAGSASEVKNCGGDAMLSGEACPLYPYRLGRGRPSVKTIRRECMICMNGQRDLIRHCASVKCNLHAFRLGHNPNVKARSEQPQERGFDGQFVQNSRRSVPAEGSTPDNKKRPLPGGEMAF